MTRPRALLWPPAPGRARAANGALTTGLLAVAITIALPWAYRLFDLAPVAFAAAVPVLGAVGMGLAAYARQWLLFALNAAALLYVPTLIVGITLIWGP